MAGLAITALTWPCFRAFAQVNEDLAARDELRRSELQDENGQIPPDAWTDAYAEKDAMPFLAEAWSEFVTAEQIQTGVKGGSWVSIGPGNIGGRMRSVIIRPPTDPSEPADQRTVWAGGVAGGVWKSTNSGGSWSPTTNGLANLAVNCMAIEPGYHAPGHEVLYAGTGEGFGNGDGVMGNGIFKTTDGGTTWIRLPSANNDPDFAWVNRLAISPNNSQILLAAVRVYPPLGQSGVFGKILRSTDGGTSWTTALTLPEDPMTDVRFRPNGGPSFVPAINCLASSYNGAVYYSIDDGATWTTRTGEPGWLPPPVFAQRVELAYSQSNPLIVYASRGVPGNIASVLYRSDNGGFSFRSLGHPSIPSNLPGADSYTNVLWVDPTDPDTVVVGGVYTLRTRDAGAEDGPHWEEATNVGLHQDHHRIVEDPLYDGINNRIVYDVNDGGISKTENILATVGPNCDHPPCVQWTRLNNKLYVTQFYGAAGNGPTGTIFGGTQDNGTVRFRPDHGAQDWDTLCFRDPVQGYWVCGGDTTKCATDQTSEPYLYYAQGALNICRKANDDLPADFIWGGPGHAHGIPGDCGGFPCADGLAPFVIDPNPNQQARMVAGGRSLWRTTNATDNPQEVCWLEIKSPYPSNCISNCDNIRALAVAEGDSDIIWVGYKTVGRVFHTINGTLGTCPTPSSTPTWFSGDPSLVLPQNRPCTHIAIAHSTQSISRKVYVTFGSFYLMEETAGNVWKRENDGVTWTDISHNRLPRVPVYSLVISPSNPDFLYVATEVGIFASANDGMSWSPAFGGSASDVVFSLVSSSTTSDPDIIYAGTNAGVFATADGGETWAPGFGGPANTPVVELFWMINGTSRQLVGATHGRGMFSLTAAN